MAIKLYQLYCEYCHWKRITDGSDIQDLIEIKKSSIQRNIPKLNPATKEVIPSKFKKQPKKFKCKDCGRPVSPKKIADPQALINQRLEEEQRAERIKLAEVEEERKLKEVISKAEKESEERRKQNGKKINPYDGSEASSS